GGIEMVHLVGQEEEIAFEAEGLLVVPPGADGESTSGAHFVTDLVVAKKHRSPRDAENGIYFGGASRAGGHQGGQPRHRNRHLGPAPRPAGSGASESKRKGAIMN